MTIYYRAAVESDFSKFEEYDYARPLGDELKKVIEDGDIQLAIKHFKNKTGMGVFDSKKHCLRYQNYIQAKKNLKLENKFL